MPITNLYCFYINILLNIGDAVADAPFSPLQPQRQDDIWSLYPWRSYQAGDQAYWLTRRFNVDQATPQQIARPDGSIVMHSKLLTSGMTMAKNENTIRRLDPNSLLGLI